MFREFHHQTRGRGHVEDGTPCQDRTAYLNRAGIQVLCLADGAGSATRSELGAQALVDEGCKLLAESFQQVISRNDGAQVKVEIVQRLLRRLVRVAQRRHLEMRDLAATFLAVAVSDSQFIAIHVGDGVIGYVKDGELKVISAPDNDEFANQTTFVTSESAATTMRLLRGSLSGVTGFVLMSDGPANSLFDHRSNTLATACRKVIELVASASPFSVPGYKYQIRRLLDTKIRESTKDDCSLAVFGRDARQVETAA
ncbi:MAG: PP2C family serine/threonine-protein phosphatase [Microbacteriaceae bacterium]